MIVQFAHSGFHTGFILAMRGRTELCVRMIDRSSVAGARHDMCMHTPSKYLIGNSGGGEGGDPV